jgi:PPOX class probable F420-dependent enzyme
MVDEAGQPLVVPLCYATDGRAIYSALDEKPKRVRPAALARVRAIRAHPAVTLVVDDYSEDWTHLAYLLVRGEAAFLDPGGVEHGQAVVLLRAKYPQYRTMSIEAQPVLRLRPARSTFWTARPAS